MSTETPPPAVPGATVPTPTPAPAPDPAANAAFAEMRTKLAAAEKEKTELAERLTALERKDMDEKTRMAAELADAKKIAEDLTPLRDAHGRFQAQLEQACANEIAAIPEDKRAAVEDVVKHIPLENRLTAIQSMRTVAGSPPVSGGTITQPSASPNGGMPGSPEDAKPLTNQELQKAGWKETIMARGVKGGPDQALTQQVAELTKQVAALAAASQPRK